MATILVEMCVWEYLYVLRLDNIIGILVFSRLLGKAMQIWNTSPPLNFICLQQSIRNVSSLYTARMHLFGRVPQFLCIGRYQRLFYKGSGSSSSSERHVCLKAHLKDRSEILVLHRTGHRDQRFKKGNQNLDGASSLLAFRHFMCERRKRQRFNMSKKSFQGLVPAILLILTKRPSIVGSSISNKI